MRLRQLIALSTLYATSAGALRLAGIVVFLWLARALSVDEYAHFGILYALQQAIATFAIAGIVEAVIGQLTTRADRRDAIFAASGSAFLAMSGAFGGVALAGALIYPGAAYPMLVIGGVIVGGVASAFASLQSQLTRLRENHAASLSFATFPPLAGFLCAALAFAFEPTLRAYYLGFAVGTLLCLSLFWISRVGSWTFLGAGADVSALLGAALSFIAVAFFGWMSGYGNNFVISTIFERDEIARFTFAMTVSSVIQLAASALNQVWSPHFYVLLRDTHSIDAESENRKFYRMLSVVLGALSAGILIFYAPFVRMLGGNLVAYDDLGVELLILFSSYVLLSPWWQCHNYYLARSHGRELLAIVLWTSVVGITSWIALMWLLGPLGIYLGFLAQMLFRAAGIVFAARRRWSIRVSWGGLLLGLLLACAGFLLSLI